MGCCGSEESQANAMVGKEIRDLRSNHQRVHKLLLLGTGNSGKSTFFKQLTQIHGGGFHDEEYIQSSKHIQDSVVVQMKNLLMGFPNVEDLKLDDDISNEARIIRQVSPEQPLCSVAQQITILWNDPRIRGAWNQRSNLGISDSAPHFFNGIDRIAAEDYRPTNEDILLARIPTTGIRNKRFSIQNNVFDIYDVGGQRSERSKWINCFETVHAILFVSSLNCYDQMLYEENVNAMREAMELFSQVVNSRYFRKTSVILFLNKSDLFEEKITRVHLSVLFADYEYVDDGDSDEFTFASDYIRDQFKSQCILKDKQIYSHVTCATHRDNVEKVFDDVQHSVVMNALKNNGLM
jgi:GTPase SAR1 family protein